MKTMLKLSIVLAFSFAGCATSPSPAEVTRQQAAAEAQIASEQQDDEARRAYEEAAVSRAALKKYLHTNLEGKYADKAKGYLDATINAVK
ncbi:MAG: hypothetical protein L0Y67_01675 [Gammaproteobacteria bacterium]|nr:hypothetical protein [Gammaproteobacteria bacterium]